MKYSFEIKDKANQEIIEAYLYYESKQVGLGERFLQKLETYFDRIKTNPNHFPLKRKPYREAFIKKFPYLIIYEFTDNEIVVYSIFNTSRNPQKKP